MEPRWSRAADAARSADAAQTMMRGRSMLIYRLFSGAKSTLASMRSYLAAMRRRRLLIEAAIHVFAKNRVKPATETGMQISYQIHNIGRPGSLS